MAIRVTMRIYSGRPNPTVTMDGAYEQNLLNKLLEMPVSPALGPIRRVGGLGFRGYVIERLGPPAASPVYLYNGVADFFGLAPARLDPNRKLELSLLDAFPAEAVQARSESIYGDPQCQPAPSGKNRALPGRKLYKPEPWNDPNIVFRNNCYNYANNERFKAGFSATAGMHGGLATPFGDCHQMTDAVMADGLVPVSNPNRQHFAGNGWPIALFIRGNGSDHHFYRQDKTGRWSHKPGAWPVRNCDESGAPIEDVENADTLDYVFCGYFRTNEAVDVD